MLMSMAFWHLLSDSLSWHSAMATVGASTSIGASVGASVCAAVGAVVTDETASHVDIHQGVPKQNDSQTRIMVLLRSW